MSRRSFDKRQRARARNQRRAEARTAKRRWSGATEQASKTSAADPMFGTEAPTIEASRCWYAARLKPRIGPETIKALTDKGVVAVAPRVSEITVRAGRRLPRSRQLLLRTVFVGVRRQSDLETVVQAQRGVAGIVSVPKEDVTATGNVPGFKMEPARLDPIVLQNFVSALAKNEVVQPFGVKEGDSVIVRSGTFSTFPGVVEQILPHEMAKVAVAMFGRATPVDLPIADLDRVS